MDTLETMELGLLGKLVLGRSIKKVLAQQSQEEKLEVQMLNASLASTEAALQAPKVGEVVDPEAVIKSLELRNQFRATSHGINVNRVLGLVGFYVTFGGALITGIAAAQWWLLLLPLVSVAGGLWALIGVIEPSPRALVRGVDERADLEAMSREQRNEVLLRSAREMIRRAISLNDELHSDRVGLAVAAKLAKLTLMLSLLASFAQLALMLFR